MNLSEFVSMWPVLKRQVRSLSLPWLDQMSRERRSPFEVLASCLLSLRTQDRVTEEASGRLFQLGRTPEELARIPVPEIEKAIYPVGFYRVKARRIRELSRDIVQKFQGRVPDKMEDLLLLKGVGRKTANLVLTLGYNKEGICVDTHVHRITNRWGLVKTKNPKETEWALREILPVKYWKPLNGYLVAFGQGICQPVSPWCSRCKVNSVCSRIGVKYSR